MAKLKHLAGSGTSFSLLTETVLAERLIHTVHSRSTSAYLDTTSEWSIVVSGSNLKYKGDIIIGGTIDKVTFRDGDGDAIAQITGFSLNALKFLDPVRTDGVRDMYAALMKGKDTITGSDARDWLVGGDGNDRINGGLGGDEIEGGRGNDTLTGGAGGDVFVFGLGYGKDVVTDFVANGVGHDRIGFYDPAGAITIGQRGADAFIALSDGSEMLLRNVTSTDLSSMEHFILGYEPTLG